MATYTKSGSRQVKLSKRKETKFHLKKFYGILDDMEMLAVQIKEKGFEVNEENVNEYALKLYGRELDSMEKMLLLGKLEQHGTPN